MTTERGLDRLIFFTDAVAAIAITLLILPLVDLVPEAARSGQPVSAFLSDNSDQLLGFSISFVVIARLWRAHHAIFEHVRAYSVTLLYLSLVWAFTIVLLPLPTAIISEFSRDRLAAGLYIGTMAVSSLTLTAISFTVTRDSTVEHTENRLTAASMVGSATTSALFVAALAIALVFPAAGIWSLLVLFLTGPLSTLVLRRMARRSTVSARNGQ
jgi:uncharacterized membrane protein